MADISITLIVIAGLLLLGALGETIFARTRIPDVVWLVAAGTIVGPVLNLVPAALLKPGVPYFGAIALTVILSGGAFRLRLADVTAAAPRGIALGLAGYLSSTAAIFALLWVGNVLGYVSERSPLISQRERRHGRTDRVLASWERGVNRAAPVPGRPRRGVHGIDHCDGHAGPDVFSHQVILLPDRVDVSYEAKPDRFGCGCSAIPAGMPLPAALLATRGRGFTAEERRLMIVSIPRGLAAGVLATLPSQLGIAGMEDLAPMLHALIVFSIVVFAIGHSIVDHSPGN